MFMRNSLQQDRTFQALHASVFRRADISSTPQVNMVSLWSQSQLSSCSRLADDDDNEIFAMALSTELEDMFLLERAGDGTPVIAC